MSKREDLDLFHSEMLRRYFKLDFYCNSIEQTVSTVKNRSAFLDDIAPKLRSLMEPALCEPVDLTDASSEGDLLCIVFGWHAFTTPGVRELIDVIQIANAEQKADAEPFSSTIMLWSLLVSDAFSWNRCKASWSSQRQTIADEYREHLAHLSTFRTSAHKAIRIAQRFYLNHREEFDKTQSDKKSIWEPEEQTSSNYVDYQGAIDLVKQELKQNGLALFCFLLTRKHFTDYATLKEKVWDKEISDPGIKTAIERLAKALNDMTPHYFSIENQFGTRRVRMEYLPSRHNSTFK